MCKIKKNQFNPINNTKWIVYSSNVNGNDNNGN